MSNGRLKPKQLVEVSGVQLIPATAHAFEAMAAACLAATGVRLDIVNGGGGYRDLAYQRAMYQRRAQYLPIRIAPPGQSTHGLGTALDLTTTCFTPAVARWCRAHCREYGFALPPSNDPRHFLHDGVRRGSIPAGETSTTVDPTPAPEEIDVTNIRYHYKPTNESAAEFGIFGAQVPPSKENPAGGWKVTTDAAVGAAWGRLYGRADGGPWTDDMTRTQWVALQAVAAQEHVDWQAQLAPAGSSSDLKTILAAIAAVPAAVVAGIRAIWAPPAR